MIRFSAWLAVFMLLPAASPRAQDAVVDGQPRVILPSIVQNNGETAIANLRNPEQVFCYEVSAIPPGFTGYTLHNMAITGFCSVIPLQAAEVVLQELIMNPENIRFGEKERCEVKPRLVLRFVRGIDATDILLSSPCHSLSIFYGGRVRTYNFKPGAEVIDGLLEILHARRTDFVSPALLNQLLPIGVILKDSDRQLLQNQAQPARNWGAGYGNASVAGAGAPPRPSAGNSAAPAAPAVAPTPAPASAPAPADIPKPSWGVNTGESNSGSGWNKLAK